MKPQPWLMLPILAFLLSRVLIFGAGLIGDTLLPTEPGHWMAVPDNPFLSTWAKWDSQYYYDIATNGYWFRPGQQSNVAFFPIYPLLMRSLAPLTGNSVILAGFLISNLSLLGALIFLYRLTELELDAASAKRAVFYLAFFPTAFFFNSIYTESTFLLFSIGAMYFARRHEWMGATVFGILAAATRNLGVLTWALVMWEWLRVQGWSIKQVHKKQNWLNLWQGIKANWFEVLVISLILSGMLVYMVFLQRNFERPLAFIETQAAWGRENIGPLGVIGKSLQALLTGEINKGWLTLFWNTAALLTFLAFVPFIWQRLGEGYAIYVLIMMLIPSSSATGSMIRYVLTSYPAFMLLGWWGRRDSVDRALLAGFAVFLGLFVSIFANWFFVA